MEEKALYSVLSGTGTNEVDEILNSKIYYKENAMVNFKAPDEYISPFLKIWGNLELRVRGKKAVINENKDGSQNIAYSRINIEAVSSKLVINNEGKIINSEYVYGMIYALDIDNPVIKIYRGTNVVSCLNLMVLNSHCVHSFDLINNFNVAVEYMQSYVDSFYADKVVIEKLIDTKIDRTGYNELMGRLLHNSIKNSLGTSVVVHIAKEAMNKKSVYYEALNKDKVSLFDIYDTGTYYLSNIGDFKENPNKSLILSNELLTIAG